MASSVMSEAKGHASGNTGMQQAVIFPGREFVRFWEHPDGSGSSLRPLLPCLPNLLSKTLMRLQPPVPLGTRRASEQGQELLLMVELGEQEQAT